MLYQTKPSQMLIILKKTMLKLPLKMLLKKKLITLTWLKLSRRWYQLLKLISVRPKKKPRMRLRKRLRKKPRKKPRK